MLKKNKGGHLKIALITIRHNSSVHISFRDQFNVDYIMDFLRKDKKGTIIYKIIPTVWQEGFFRRKTCYGFLILYKRKGEKLKRKERVFYENSNS